MSLTAIRLCSDGVDEKIELNQDSPLCRGVSR
jgi:hypothetical protein